MSRPVIILGGGGHARVLIDALILSGVTIVGVAAREPPAGLPDGIPFLGDDDAVAAYPPGAVELVNGVGSVDGGAARARLFAAHKARGFAFATIVHPAAIVGRDVDLGEGVQVMAGAVLQTGSRIGANTIVNTRVSVDHDARIGASCHIAPGCVLSGGVTVGEGSHVGTGAVIIQNVTIGSGALVGAGAVVVEDVPDNAVVLGVPARQRK